LHHREISRFFESSHQKYSQCSTRSIGLHRTTKLMSQTHYKNHNRSLNTAVCCIIVLIPEGCGGNCRPGGKLWQPTARFMTHITCRLTAKKRDQLRNPTVGNRVWATFMPLPFYLRCYRKTYPRPHGITVKTVPIPAVLPRYSRYPHRRAALDTVPCQ